MICRRAGDHSSVEKRYHMNIRYRLQMSEGISYEDNGGERMKQKLLLAVCTGVLAGALMLGGCSNITQEEFDTLQAENKSLKAQVEKQETELESTKTTLDETTSSAETAAADLGKTKKELEKVKKEFAAYQEKMKPYEEMTAAQAEEEKARAEQEKKRIEEEEAAKKAAEEKAAAQAEAEAKAAKEAEEAKGYETGITYDQLARTPDDYEGKKVKFRGKVIQVMEDGGKVMIRLAVNSDYDTVLLGIYESAIVSSRVLEDDVITIYGTSGGVISYTSTMGGQVSVPSVLIDKIEQ